MGIIKDQRPRDWTYVATFNEKDLPSLQLMIKQINETHDGTIIEKFNQRCEQKLRGEKPEGPEFEVTKSEDLVVNAGLQQCINIILGTSAVRWRYVALEEVVAPAPAVTDTTMSVAELSSRLDMSINGGWREAVGMKLFFGAIAHQTYLKAFVREVGLFNSQSGATMLNHNVFNNNPLARTQGLSAAGTVYKNVFIISSVVEFCPVV
jgi:hypothetical protein